MCPKKHTEAWVSKAFFPTNPQGMCPQRVLTTCFLQASQEKLDPEEMLETMESDSVTANLLQITTLSVALGSQGGAIGVNISCGAWPTGPSTDRQDLKQFTLAPEKWSKGAESVGL